MMIYYSIKSGCQERTIMLISETYGRREACRKGRAGMGAAELKVVPVQEFRGYQQPALFLKLMNRVKRLSFSCACTNPLCSNNIAVLCIDCFPTSNVGS